MIIVKIGQGRGKVGGKAGKAIRNLPWDLAKKNPAGVSLYFCVSSFTTG